MKSIKEDLLFNYIQKNDNENLFKLLKKDKSKINILNKEGISLLHIAIIKGNIEAIKNLLKLGANPDITSSNKKQTPLHFAYIYNNDKTEEIIKILKLNKANINILDKDDKKPIDYLSQKKKNIFINKIQGDIDNCELNDEYEDEYDEEKNNDKENSQNISLVDSLEKSLKKNEIDKTKISNKIPNINYPNSFNDIIKKNKTEDQIYKEIITKKRFSLNSRNSNLTSIYSTEEKTKSKNTKEKEKGKVTMITNNDVVEFNYEDPNPIKVINNNNIHINNINTINHSMTNHNTSFNVLNKETINENENILFTRKNTNNKNINNINKELKYWLDNINLIQYLNNFIQNDIININILINQMKSLDNKLNYDDIESLLKIHKPGHIYRIIVALQISAGLINSKIADFLVKKNKNNLNKSNNNLKLSVSKEINPCINCFKMNFLFSQKKNDLNNFLLRYNLEQFKQNFYHNGFDMMNYIMGQMFSDEPIDDIILENSFHIYDENNRKKVLNCLLFEKDKINYFLNSNEFLQFNAKHKIKYEDIIFEKIENNNEKSLENDLKNEKIIIPNNSSCIDCNIF